jgi:hypothetical protein
VTEILTARLAERVMHWTATPARFLTGNRGWMPRWRFQPGENLADALRLLDQAAPDEYSINCAGAGQFRVRVRIGAALGEASGPSKPLAITWAIALALGIEVGSCD